MRQLQDSFLLQLLLLLLDYYGEVVEDEAVINAGGRAMQQLQKIEIDWDIHKLIEGERRSFDEPPYIALRRLLGLPPAMPSAPVNPPSAERPWTDEGVTVPHGSHARMEYNRGAQVYEGQFLNGQLVVNGQSFDKLSAAASALAITKDGNKTALNGWHYWKVKFPGETAWRSMKELRRS